MPAGGGRPSSGKLLGERRSRYLPVGGRVIQAAGRCGYAQATKSAYLGMIGSRRRRYS